MRVFIGLDVSLAKTAICVVDRDGDVQWQGKVPSEPNPIIERAAQNLVRAGPGAVTGPVNREAKQPPDARPAITVREVLRLLLEADS